MEKPQTLWHSLKLHPYGDDIEGKRERRDTIVSQNYEEVVFNEPVEQLYDILTGGTGTTQQQSKGKSSKGAKQQQNQQQQNQQQQNQQQHGSNTNKTAELPHTDSSKNPYSQKTESKELDRLSEAIKTVDQLLKDEKSKLADREAKLEELRKSEGVVVPPKKK